MSIHETTNSTPLPDLQQFPFAPRPSAQDDISLLRVVDAMRARPVVAQ